MYEKCLRVEFQNIGLEARFQQPICVYYKDHLVGEFSADIVVNDSVIVELKSVTRVIQAHEIGLVNYLVATKKPVGLILNFSPTKVEVKRKVRTLD